MSTIDEIREIGAILATKNEIFGVPRFEEIELSSKIVDNFINRMIEDLLEFQVVEQFNDTSNLFIHAFIYAFGKGSECAFFKRIGYPISRISYNFDKAMHGVCAEQLPQSFRSFQIFNKTSAMLDMYMEMYEHIKRSQEKMIAEGLNLTDCIRTMLHGGFYCGKELCLSLEISEEDRMTKYTEEPDNFFDPNNYSADYRPEDYRVVNYRIGKFDEIKDELLKNLLKKGKNKG